MWSFVCQRANKRWLWTAMCRRTRQIVAYAIGDRSEETCRKLWEQIPESYRGCQSFSDFWDAYQKVFPKETHECVGKESGQAQSHGTLVQHIETIQCSLCAEDLVLFKVGFHARNRNKALHHPSQSITCYLTTTYFLGRAQKNLVKNLKSYIMSE